MERRDFLTPDPNSPVLTLGKTVINIDTEESYGALFLLVKEESLSDFFVPAIRMRPNLIIF
ncbi:hypothetical protein [Paenibacillus terrae]|uniref:hypothetical protein n=1 Tax=Paenibacillus terrae TaxID=159743 RepID=UPI0021CCD2EF|nr:hypothetical protein [Paenibacillus terrae]